MNAWVDVDKHIFWCTHTLEMLSYKTNSSIMVPMIMIRPHTHTVKKTIIIEIIPTIIRIH